MTVILIGTGIIILSRRDQEVFVEALANPLTPSMKLRTEAQSYKQKMGE